MRTVAEAAAFQASWRSGYRPFVLAGRCRDWAFGFQKPLVPSLRNERPRLSAAGDQVVKHESAGPERHGVPAELTELN